ncbi:hypothetical protein EVAR_93334_1 [Eumeta japonica]|uniref:Uncharacterized protein n=1 Tax=Eumeta variegata TaxID=151549 RepID=A0A4C1UU33_EUMVA|nr:hypothetical protein EVAR_93334_1 [Eumeta japonica]
MFARYPLTATQVFRNKDAVSQKRLWSRAPHRGGVYVAALTCSSDTLGANVRPDLRLPVGAKNLNVEENPLKITLAWVVQQRFRLVVCIALYMNVMRLKKYPRAEYSECLPTHKSKEAARHERNNLKRALASHLVNVPTVITLFLAVLRRLKHMFPRPVLRPLT